VSSRATGRAGAGVLPEPGRRSDAALDTVIIIGLGNPILSDDAVGILAVREVRRRLEESGAPGTPRPTAGSAHASARTVFAEASVGGLDLIDLLSGHGGAVLVDAAVTGKARPGEVFELDVDFLEDTTHLGTAGLAHQVDLATAWKLGRRLGLELPRHMRIVAVEAADVKTFSEELTPTVAGNFENIVRAVAGVIREVVDAVARECAIREEREDARETDGETGDGADGGARDAVGGEGSEGSRTNSL